MFLPDQPVANSAHLAAQEISRETNAFGSLEAPPRPEIWTVEWQVQWHEARCAVEAISRAYYQAKDAGRKPPEITDGVVRHYAYVMGQTVAWLENVKDDPDPDYRRVHARAITSIHGSIDEWRSLRNKLGLPASFAIEEIEQGAKALEPQHYRGSVSSPPAALPQLTSDQWLRVCDAHPPYQRPRLDLIRYLDALPAMLVEQTWAHLKKLDTDLCWPAVPYTYAEGKNRAYEAWLESLKPEEREAEITAAQGRYAALYTEKLERAQAFVRGLVAVRALERPSDRGFER
jgi:hypothetical protein